MKKFVITLLILILIAVLGFGGYVIWKLYEKVDEHDNDIMTIIDALNLDSEKNETTQNTTNNENTVVNNSVNNNTNTAEAAQNQNNVASNTETQNIPIEEQIKNAYSKKLASVTDYTGYRVEKVQVLSEEQTKKLIEVDNGQYYKTGDILAYVTYSVTPVEAGLAGNGEISGDWVINKVACVCYRNGEIVTDGTGW